jgi:hypothetical protein
MHVLGADVCHVAVLFGQPFLFKRYRSAATTPLSPTSSARPTFHADLMSALNERSAA